MDTVVSCMAHGYSVHLNSTLDLRIACEFVKCYVEKNYDKLCDNLNQDTLCFCL